MLYKLGPVMLGDNRRSILFGESVVGLSDGDEAVHAFRRDWTIIDLLNMERERWIELRYGIGQRLHEMLDDGVISPEVEQELRVDFLEGLDEGKP